MSNTMQSTADLSSPTSASLPSTPSARRKSRVTAEHTLTRVRENQRRHRARRKDYISSLEQKLEDVEKQLAEARAEIDMLRRERGDHSACESVRFECSLDHGVDRPGGYKGEPRSMEERGPRSGRHGEEPQPERRNGGPDTEVNVQQACLRIASGLPSPSPSASTDASDVASPSSSTGSLVDPSIAGPPPCCSSSLPPSTIASPECTTCATRPPPSPSESTTLCSQAYILISQQNFRNLDPATIRRWLWEGYRSAQKRGEGCRVENTVLMSLLDFISGV